MKKITLSLAGVIVTALITQSAFALDAKSVAAVNGKKISQKTYETLLKQIQAKSQKGNQAPINRQIILDELINREVLFQEAKKKKLDKNKKVVAILKQQKRNLMIQTLLSQSPAAKPVGEKELKKFYDQQVAGSIQKEYKLRHILLKTEAAAKDIISKLNDGEDFEELAKNESKDPSGKIGGDLGWLASGQMPPALSKAVAKLKKGTLTQSPVKLGNDFHVLKLEDSRKREAPKFEDSKNQISNIIQRQRVQAYITNLRDKAKIEIK